MSTFQTPLQLPPPQQQQPPAYAVPVQPQVPYGGYQSMPAQPQPPVYAQPVMYAATPVQHQHHVVMMNGIPSQIPHYGGAFSDGIFDCFADGSSCLLSFFVAPVRWAMTMERSNLMQLVYAVLIYGFAYWGSIALSTVYNQIMCNDGIHVCRGASWLPYMLWPIMMACWILTVGLGTVYRGKIRQQHNIDGDSLQDCCLHMWCNCCAIAQEARHIDRMTGYIPHVNYQRVA